jgi:hypothetical protein
LVALISHDHSWTVPTRRANNCCHAAHAAPFLADTVWQSHSLSSLASAHAERNMHARLRSPCTFPSASSDEQRGGLGLCQTHDASAAIKPVPRRPEKGYAVEANPVFANFLLESALLPRTRYHVHERVALSRVRLLNTRELFSTVCLLTKHAISV